MGNKTIVASSLALLLGAGMASAENGVYVGVGLGQASYDTSSSVLDDGSSISGFNEDDSDKAQKIYIGYRAHAHVAVELGYIDLGKASASGASDGTGSFWSAGDVAREAETDGLFFGIKGLLPVADKFSLFATVGVLDWEITDRVFESGTSIAAAKDSDADVYYGAGTAYQLGSFDLNLEYNRYDVADSDVDVISLGAQFRF